MLQLGKNLYRAQTGTGGSKTPVEIDLGTIEILGDNPTKLDLANAINDHRSFTILPDQLPVFKVNYIKIQEN